MPLQRMCVIKGRPVSVINAGEPNPHFQILLNACGVSFRVAINARSFDGSNVQYLRKEITDSDFVGKLRKNVQRDGLYTYDNLLRQTKDFGAFAPDYVRSNLLNPSDLFVDVAYSVPGEDNDLNDFYRKLIEPILSYSKSRIYVFGQVWGPDTLADEYFGYLPGAGIHDIHLNQGNPMTGGHEVDNGVYQDGMLLIQHPENKAGNVVLQKEKWDAIFLKFSSQTMDTDDSTGNPKV